jgi:hypothetical protein
MQAHPTSHPTRRASQLHSMRHHITAATVAAAYVFLAACRDPKIEVYRTPKETAAQLPATTPVHAAATAPVTEAAPAPMAPVAGAPSDMHGGELQTAAGPGLVWIAPTNWQVKKASMMRKGSYTIAGDGGATADLAITAFPGDVGGEVANVNRWRGQLELAPLDNVQAAAAMVRLESNGLKVGVVELVSTGAEPTRMIGAMVPFGGATWFFKLLGPDALVAHEKPAFLEFLKTIKASAAPTP